MVVADVVELKEPIKFQNGKFEMSFDIVLQNTGSSLATNVFTVARLQESATVSAKTNWNKTDDDLRNW